MNLTYSEMSEGDQLRSYIENKRPRVSITKLAGDLETTRQGIYQYFDSKQLKPDTRKMFEDYFGEAIFTPVNTNGKEPQAATPSQTLLEESIYNLTATQKINAMSIDRLVNILSQVFSSTQPSIAPLEPVEANTSGASQGPQGDLSLGKKYGKKNKEGTHQR